MGPDLVIRASKALGCPISQTWGLSETTGSVTISPWDEFESDGSLSPLLPNIRMRIVDEAENDVEDGQEEEFIVQGPMITRGYWKNEEATRSSFTVDGEWFKTGDLGLRRNGKIFIIDRKKVSNDTSNNQSHFLTVMVTLQGHDQVQESSSRTSRVGRSFALSFFD